MEKNYYKLKKAAKFLSEELKQKLDRFDVMEMAARGEFNLCVPFDGNVAEFKYNHPDPVRAGVFLYKLKNALIKIPPESINLRGGIVHIIPIEIIEVIANTDYKAVHPYYGGGCENLPVTKPGYFYGTYTPDPENARKIKFAAFEANSDDAVVPAQDLLDFVKKNKEPEQSEFQNEDDEKRQIKQETEILRIIRDVLKLDPQKLPSIPPGKPWVKSDVRREINIPRQPFQSDVVFNKAWDRLRENKQIKVVSE